MMQRTNKKDNNKILT